MAIDTAQQGWSRTLRRRGALISALFALLWVVLGVPGLPPGAAWAVQIAAVVITAGAVLLTFRRGGTPGIGASAEATGRVAPEGRDGQPGAVRRDRPGRGGLPGGGAPQLLPPVICLIVGLHFFPLARLFDQPQYLWTATGLCVSAAVGLVLLAGPGEEASAVVIGLLAAGTLWATSLRLALRG